MRLYWVFCLFMAATSNFNQINQFVFSRGSNNKSTQAILTSVSHIRRNESLQALLQENSVSTSRKHYCTKRLNYSDCQPYQSQSRADSGFPGFKVGRKKKCLPMPWPLLDYRCKRSCIWQTGLQGTRKIGRKTWNKASNEGGDTGGHTMNWHQISMVW